MSTSKDEIRAGFGINHELVGEYDKTLAVKCLNGTFVGQVNDEVRVFRGIPYARQPVDFRRWKRPEPAPDSDKVFEAYYNGKTPVQTQIDSERASYYPQGEDCLYLNIWSSTDFENKAVMVFFHGGSYGWGGTADPLYNGHNFVKAHPDVVMVTVGYRVGLLGFVDFRYIEGGEAFPDAPNLGILDQIEALRWIKKNISSFGGDPNNVTIFGESAGGGSVSLLPIIKDAKGLFNRVIAQSGSVALTFSKEECRDYTMKLIDGAGVENMNDLMKLSENEIIALNTRLDLDNNFPQRDGRLIPEDPYLPYKNGATADVDMIIGTNSNELNYWIGELGGIVPFRFGLPVKLENDLKRLTKADKARVKKFMDNQSGHSMWRIAELYNEVMFRLPAIKQAEFHSQNGGNVYMYYWREPSAIMFRGACHAVELAYVFGNTDETIYTGTPADKELSELVMNIWSSFAKTGNPSTEGLEWAEFDSLKRATMVLEKQPELSYDILKAQRRLLSPLLKYMINASYTKLDYNVPFVRKSAVKIAAIAAVGTAVALGIRKLLKK